MPDKPPFNALKRAPKQPRAKQTVQRIITATGELVLELGLDGLTTNKVADRANINIASLYQYFPNKQALLSALLQSHLNDVTRALNDMLEQLGEASIEESTRLWASLGIQYFRQSGGIMTELLKSQAMLSTLPEGREFERRLMEAMHRFLARQRERLQVADLDRAIYVSFTACSAIISKHLLEPVPYYQDEEIVEEVVILMRGYFY
jgi:AcrR family transcriptional regulator